MRPASLALLALLLCIRPVAAADDSSIIRLATTTSTQDSGLLEALLPAFERAHPYVVHVIAAGSGRALRLGRDGDVDLLLVHAPAAEKAFIAEGHGLKRHPLMHNDFLLVGPRDDPARLREARDAGDAMARIAHARAPFLSRGDDSGTHQKERLLWALAPLTARPPTARATTASDAASPPAWHLESGRGMGATLRMADELGAYTLVDRGAWLANRRRLRLTALFSGAPELTNPYRLIAVNPARHPGVEHNGAQALIDWLRSAEGQGRIDAFRIDGERLFHPLAALTVNAPE